MTPKEKARDLYAKFFVSTPQPYYVAGVPGRTLKFQDWDKNWTINMAVQQCLITVNEMLQESKHWGKSSERIEYWDQVRLEIKKIKEEHCINYGTGE